MVHLAEKLHTALHECLGHGSGQIFTGISPKALKNYSSTLGRRQGRFVALYYLMDPKW